MATNWLPSQLTDESLDRISLISPPSFPFFARFQAEGTRSRQRRQVTSLDGLPSVFLSHARRCWLHRSVMYKYLNPNILLLATSSHHQEERDCKNDVKAATIFLGSGLHSSKSASNIVADRSRRPA